MASNSNILRISLRINDKLNGNGPLVVRLPGFGRKVRLHRVNHLRSADAATDAHHATAVAATRARACACAVTDADSAAKTFAEARSCTLTLRGKNDLRRVRCTEMSRSAGVRHL